MKNPRLSKNISGLLIAGCYLMSVSAIGGTLSLTQTPMANQTTTSVFPNLLFVLDNSGSMSQDYTPDYVNDSGMCRTGSGGSACAVGDPPYMSSDFNYQYYNPAITYTKAVDYLGNTYKDPALISATPAYPATTYVNPFTSTSTKTITTTYPDTEWCTDYYYSSCIKNGNYIAPNSTYYYRHDLSNSNPYYYYVVPTEYCTDSTLTNCTTASAATAAYPVAAKVRWCSDTALTNCQGKKTPTYKYPRALGASTAGTTAAGSMTISGTTKNSKVTVTSIKVGGVEILGATVTLTPSSNSSSSNNTSVASAIANQIAIYTSSPDYTASNSSAKVTITASSSGSNANGSITYSISGATITVNSNVTGGTSGTTQSPYTWARVDIIPSVTSYAKASTRTDCAGSTCTYTEELTNFANWYAYYRTRIQMMKTSAGQAFTNIGSNYRVGFTTINNNSGSANTSGTNYVRITDFTSSAKSTWYNMFYSISPTGATPTRASLSIAGRIFAGKNPYGLSSSDDPMIYSCQQNFVILTTDGYWNETNETAVTQINGSTRVNNQDNVSSTVSRPQYDGNGASDSCPSGGSCLGATCQGSTNNNSSYSSCNTLADVAEYYYTTDIRDQTAFNNCTGAKDSSGNTYDVCANNVPSGSLDTAKTQHVTLFTLGLGVDGLLNYVSDYQTATSGDFYAISQGNNDWPQVKNNDITGVDDLWHAAVNGRGQYFSARNPTSLSSGLATALAGVSARLGAGAAAATSNLEPVTGDNYAYVASYTTVKWYGNLEARQVNTQTGVVDGAAIWCETDISANATTGATDCSGQMKALVGTTSDSRNIYFYDSSKSNKLSSFTWNNLSSSQKCLFDISASTSCSPKVTLSQYSTLSTTQKANATGANLVNYLRGQYGYEIRDSNSVDNQIFRQRTSALGDIVDSQPVYVKKPYFTYTDPGYATFQTNNASRTGMVYIGANDGMLHAFNASTGVEQWAYVPHQVMAQMYLLADSNYANLHRYMANGAPSIGDICVSNCNDTSAATWKTILVAPFNGGGAGYYALDITDPANPQALWEIDSSTDANLGYSYGAPVVTKDASGNWVVLVTSGYNNNSATGSTGKGYLYVINPTTGAIKNKLATTAGDTTTPSGLSKISAWADYPTQNNQATYIYGGDLLGNMWRFDFNNNVVAKIATLTDPSGTAQPITTRPELTSISDTNGTERVIYVVTGEYLTLGDLTNTQTQTVYAFKDLYDSQGTITSPRTSLVKETIAVDANGTTRSVATNSNTADLSGSDLGWYVDLPESGERGNIDPALIAGSLLVPSNVPESNVCTAGGHSWLNVFDYKKGAVKTVSIYSANAIIVGMVVLQVAGGFVVNVTNSDNPTPMLEQNVPWQGITGAVLGHRVNWRELP